MTGEIVTFETAKLAKEKGFNWGCDYFYHKAKTPYATRGIEYNEDTYVEDYNWNNGVGYYPTKAEDVLCSAPTQASLQKWLRETHNCHIWVIPERHDLFVPYYHKGTGWTFKEEAEPTYEEALEKGLSLVLKLIERHDNG